jgi:hypothetical protein
MTTVPLPDTPCVRCRLGFQQTDSFEGGVRFFLSYSGSAPSAANCATLASDIATAYSAQVAAWVNDHWYLSEVDVLDIATVTGLSGQATPSIAGTRSGTPVPAQLASNVEFDIARRYRGGKPRIFWPPGDMADLVNDSTWDTGFQAGITTMTVNFFAQIAALSIGSMGTLKHVNLSYYRGFTNITNSSGRIRAVPTYRATALHDNVTGYAGKATVGSQKRRRIATTY